jgi:BirA family transcriptional regulator, biotin operon repressor / biotin---[acetyl-CoA-carboxylase] ligase
LRQEARAPSGEAGDLERTTLLAGLASARAVERAALQATGHSIRVQIKWPNDLLIEHRKLAGILVERRGEQMVVGIGINVAQGAHEFPREMRGRATSLYQATGKQVDRLRVAAAVVEEFDGLCVKGNGRDDESWLGEWKFRCAMLGSEVEARVGDRVVIGQVIDVDPLHGLILRDRMGAVQFLSAQTATLAG